MNTMVQFRKKRPKMTFNDKQAFDSEQERVAYAQLMQQKCAMPYHHVQKVLDGLLLQFSCRVKVASQAVRSKLAGENIVDVKEEDMLAFSNLSYLDLSDNNVKLHQLANLLNLRELDLSYNNI